jgi:hypothetical protein
MSQNTLKFPQTEILNITTEVRRFQTLAIQRRVTSNSLALETLKMQKCKKDLK